MKTTSKLFLIFIVSSIFFYNIYAFILNQSGHTGIDLVKIKFAYGIFSVVSIVLAFKTKKSKLFFIAGILGIAFIINIWILEITGVMHSYEDWIGRGL